MRILFDRNVEPRYIEAIGEISGLTAERADDHFPQTAPDHQIASLAEREGWVVFSRDDDFFEEVRAREIGLLFFSKRHNTPAGEIAHAVKQIIAVYNAPTQIEEGLPGQWV